MLNETGRYICIITLTNEIGELPNKEEATELIASQMSGELDETTGLACMAVEILSDPIGLG